jgi:inner membrane protein
MTPEGFVEGERSLVADRGLMRFRAYSSDQVALKVVSGYRAVERLQWFSHGFMKAQQSDRQLVLPDLRMGVEPDYSFRFAVAKREDGAWREIAPQQLRWPWEARRRFGWLWRRIWREPATAAESLNRAVDG